MITLDTIRELDVRRLDPTRLDLTRLDVRRARLPKFDLPEIDLPKFELPKLDLPEVDLGAELDRAAKLARDAAYVGVGAAVVTGHQLDAWRRRVTDEVTSRVRRVTAG